MSRKLHIYCHTEREVSTIDAPLSDVSWSLVVMVVLLGFALLLLSSECILIAINWTGFTKNNPLMFVHSLHECPHNVNYFYRKTLLQVCT